MLINASFGLLHSVDDGEQWSWTCTDGLGFMIDDDPRLFTAIRNDGSLHGASAFGLYSYDNCAWERPEPFGADFHSALVRDPQDDTLWTVTSNANGENHVYRAEKSGRWATYGPALPSGLLFEGLAIGISGDERVMVSAIERENAGQPRRALALVLEKNAWVSSVIADVESPVFAEFLTERLPMGAPLIIALTDRSSGAVTSTLTTRDNAKTWLPIAELEGKRIVDAVWSEDGGTLWVGGRAGAGIWQSSDGAQTFEAINPDVEASCLYERAGVLFICGDQYADGFMLGKSSDGGRSIEPIADFASIVEQFLCGPSTPVTSMCATPALDLQNDLDLTLQTPAEPDSGCRCGIQVLTSPTFAVFSGIFCLAWLTRRRASAN